MLEPTSSLFLAVFVGLVFFLYGIGALTTSSNAGDPRGGERAPRD